MESELNSIKAGGVHDLSLQCLRILRCTARSMVSSPGGLRFRAGTRPWLDGLADVGSPAAGKQTRSHQHPPACLPISRH